MAQTILSAPCVGGPLDGQMHTQTTSNGFPRAGVFNYVSQISKVRGSYSIGYDVDRRLEVWKWGPWIKDAD